jgi:FtsP/CotA-like multicopper oxidase with cupredoxin domain
MDSDDLFPTTIEGLSEASSPDTVRLRHGERLDLRITPVRKRLGDAEVRMLAYNGSIPGPTLRVVQGSEIIVHASNDGDIDTTVHWHGLRLENLSDGVPDETQAPIAIGGEYTCRVQFPDPGVYWYHPHLREDFAQEMGLYGAIVVEPSDASYWPAVDRELTITLDDVLIEDGRMSPFHRSGPNFTAMGRFGNVMLTNGETRLSAAASAGEVVRLYLINTANTRIFNVAMAGARMKLVGSDSGRYERETFVDEVMISPSERAVIDVMFDAPGEARLEHRTPERSYELGVFAVAASDAPSRAATSYDELRTDPELAAERASLGTHVDRAPDKVLAFVASMPLLYGTSAAAAPAGYVCPMHPEVTATEAGSCTKCGMRLVPRPAAAAVAASYVCPMHPEVTDTKPGTCPQCGMKLVPSDAPSSHAESPAHGDAHGDAQAAAHAGHDTPDGIEWEDLMPGINRAADPSNMIWKIIDRTTGAENHTIDWRFTVGDRVKIRIVNEMESDHPMHHPFHVHGAGRFLILARDGVPEPNLAWKDTVLVRAGEAVDILLDVTNPGRWMAHCHIAEHTESGMMFSFDVVRRAENGVADGAGAPTVSAPAPAHGSHAHGHHHGSHGHARGA